MASTAGSSSPKPGKQAFSFAESNPKVRMELRKAELLLQKQFELMEKQSRTKTNNISNHQQVLKNSWRRLEQKKAEDQLTPLGSRKNKKGLLPAEERTKRLMFSNKTAISMETVPKNGAGVVDDLTSSSSLPYLDQQHPSTHQPSSYRDTATSNGSRLPPIATDQLKAGGHHLGNSLGPAQLSSMQRSPFISSPYAFRRRNPVPSSPKPERQHPLSNTSSKSLDQPKITDLPALDASMNTKTRMLSSLSTKQMSKDALLRVGKLLEMDDSNGTTANTGSRGPEAFKRFYESSSTSGTQLTGSAAQLPISLDDLEEMSEEEFLKSLSKEEKEQVQTAKEENSELTLAEMFEQIRHCRYIRLYHPYGSKDDNDEQQ